MRESTAAFERRSYTRLSEAAGVVLLGVTAMVALSLVSYDATDPSWFTVSSKSHTTNFIGEPGAFIAALLLQALGLASFVPVLCLGGSALQMILGTSSRGRLATSSGLTLLLVSVAGLLDLGLDRVVLGGETAPAGGMLGAEVRTLLAGSVNGPGAVICLITALLVGTILFTGVSAGGALRGLQRAAFATMAQLRTRTVRAVLTHRRDRMRAEVLRRHAEEVRDEVAKSRRDVPPPAPRAIAEAAADVLEAPQESELERATQPEPPPPPPRPASPRGKPRQDSAIRDHVRSFMADRGDGKATLRIEPPAPAPEQLPLPVAPPVEEGPGGLPPHSILRTPDGELDVDEKELFEKGKALESKFKEFQVAGSVVQIHPGPVVTTYEFKVGPGIKFSRLTSLADDVCLALKAESIRIDRISGKSTVGIEVPNGRRETIFLREILQSDAWKASTSPLTIALGKLINGEPCVSDLARMPHLLMAGSTGAGKSVSLHSMIASILFRATPEEVRFVMIDPKTVELAVYDKIPHLLCPVVVDPKLAANALKWATREMEKRYKMLARYGVRSIDQFNAILRTAGKPPQPKDGPPDEEARPLPYIVVVIDELADLMMVSSTEVEEAITRLAQMARAVGIHLILATQRPSVDVITGVIKANFPSRISFRVASKTDSRTILDSNGAEQLLGRGDMLFMPPGSARLVRVHGPLITEREADALAEYLRKRAQPVYTEEVTKAPEAPPPGQGGEGDVDDEVYREAVRLVVRTGQASVSNLQRKLRLGYSRAARLVDVMEEEGIVSKQDGVRPRRVLMTPREFETRFGMVE